VFSWLVERLAGTSDATSYLLILALVFADALPGLGVLLPGEAPVMVGGVLGGSGAINPWFAGAVAAAAAVAGDTTSYWIGRWLSRDRAVKWGRHVGVTEERVAAAERFLGKHGATAVAGSRFASALRAVVPLVAGLVGFPYGRFLRTNAAACVVWAAAYTAIGYAAGERWRTVARSVDWAGLGIVVMLIFVIAARAWTMRGRD
jgi:undecaprenyl-diphosphatase